MFFLKKTKVNKCVRYEDLTIVPIFYDAVKVRHGHTAGLTGG